MFDSWVESRPDLARHNCALLPSLSVSRLPETSNDRHVQNDPFNIVTVQSEHRSSAVDTSILPGLVAAVLGTAAESRCSNRDPIDVSTVSYTGSFSGNVGGSQENLAAEADFSFDPDLKHSEGDLDEHVNRSVTRCGRDINGCFV
jgi:hypothetical protein